MTVRWPAPAAPLTPSCEFCFSDLTLPRQTDPDAKATLWFSFVCRGGVKLCIATDAPGVRRAMRRVDRLKKICRNKNFGGARLKLMRRCWMRFIFQIKWLSFFVPSRPPYNNGWVDYPISLTNWKMTFVKWTLGVKLDLTKMGQGVMSWHFLTTRWCLMVMIFFFSSENVFLTIFHDDVPSSRKSYCNVFATLSFWHSCRNNWLFPSENIKK